MGYDTMARRKQNSKKNELINAIIEEYQPGTAADVQNALKDIFEPMFQGKMISHLGYEKNARNSKSTTNRRNGYSKKTVRTTNGNISIDIPRDHEATFEPKIIPKGCKDVSGIEDKILSMYAKGMSQRDIASTIEDIYGFEISHETISEITDSVLEHLEQW